MRCEVVLPVTVFDPPDWATKWRRVKLSRVQVKDSPDVDSEKPVFRQQELAMRDSFGPLACRADAKLGLTSIPAGVKYPTSEGEDPHLRSAPYVTGYEVRGTDGAFGRVEGYMMEGGSRHLGYFEVETRDWLH